MKIEIEKAINIKAERKAKLLNLNSDKKIKEVVGFRWKIIEKPISEDEVKENLKNLQLFCLQISRDILLNKFFTNERGQVKYDIDIEDDIIKKIDQVIQQVYKRNDS